MVIEFKLVERKKRELFLSIMFMNNMSVVTMCLSRDVTPL